MCSVVSVRNLISSLIIGMSGRLVGCEGMYRIIINSGVSGLLENSKNNSVVLCSLVWGFW